MEGCIEKKWVENKTEFLEFGLEMEWKGME